MKSLNLKQFEGVDGKELIGKEYLHSVLLIEFEKISSAGVNHPAI